MPNSSFGDILSQFEQAHASPAEHDGTGREGTVIAVSGDSVFVDVGLKIESILPASELRDKSGALNVHAGDKFRVGITGRDAEGYYILSKLKVRRPKDWAGLESAFQEKRAIAGVVTGAVKGGLSVDVGVRAFMPASRSGTKDAAEMGNWSARRSPAESSRWMLPTKTWLSTAEPCSKRKKRARVRNVWRT